MRVGVVVGVGGRVAVLVQVGVALGDGSGSVLVGSGVCVRVAAGGAVACRVGVRVNPGVCVTPGVLLAPGREVGVGVLEAPSTAVLVGVGAVGLLGGSGVALDSGVAGSFPGEGIGTSPGSPGSYTTGSGKPDLIVRRSFWISIPAWSDCTFARRASSSGGR